MFAYMNGVRVLSKAAHFNYIVQLAGSLLRSTYLGYSAPFKGWRLEERKSAKI